MLADLRFHLSWVLTSSCAFSCSGRNRDGTGRSRAADHQHRHRGVEAGSARQGMATFAVAGAHGSDLQVASRMGSGCDCSRQIRYLWDQVDRMSPAEESWQHLVAEARARAVPLGPQ